MVRFTTERVLIVKKLIGKLFLFLNGWKAIGERPPYEKYVLIAAPHTSNWDLPFMLALSFVFDMKVQWMGKHTLFKFPYRTFMKLLGGVAIRRHLNENVVDATARQLREADKLILLVPTEGTRSRVEFWKSGFYHIAVQAGVPIVPGYMDYRRKEGGFGDAFHPTGEIDKDMDALREFYSDKVDKFPEKFGPVRLRNESAEEPKQATGS